MNAVPGGSAAVQAGGSRVPRTPKMQAPLPPAGPLHRAHSGHLPWQAPRFPPRSCPCWDLGKHKGGQSGALGPDVTCGQREAQMKASE